jgi:hypothetical protein
VPFLSSIVREQKARKVNPKRERKEGIRDGYQCKTKEIFIAREVSHNYNNEHRFGSRMPTRVRRFKNRASCASYPDSQANYPTF